MTVSDMKNLLDLTTKEVNEIEEEVKRIQLKKEMLDRVDKAWFYNHHHMIE